MFKNYLKTAFRNLWKNKGYSSLNIIGLAIGITCAGLIFLWVEDELNYDHHNLKIENLYQVYENQTYDGKTYTFSATPGMLSGAIKSELPGIKNSCRTTWQQTKLFTLGEKSISQDGRYADSSIFSLFTIPFLDGSPQHVFDQIRSVVITEKMAKKFFNTTTNVVGKTLKIDNGESYTITGIVKDLPQNSTVKFDWLLPFQIYFDENNWLKDWGSNGIQTYVEVYPKSNPATIDKQLFGYIQTKDSAAIARAFLLPMKDWRLRNAFEDGKRVTGRIQYVRMFSTIAWIILLIACINFMNLATARSEKRAKEVGVRKVMGAGKGLLARQFIIEAILMAYIAVVFSILFMFLLLPAFNNLVEKTLSLNLESVTHIVALLLIGLVSGIIAGSYPSFYLSSFNPISVFKGLKMKSGSANIIRKGLVVLQFTISIVLIICTIIIYQQIQHVKGRDLGYDRNNLIEMAGHDELKKNFVGVKHDLLATGAVENAAQANLNMLYMGSSTNDFSWIGKDPNKKLLITQDFVSPEYLSTTRVKLIQGRDFYPDAKQDSLSVIINETLAKLIDKNNAVGKLLLRDTVKYTIIGVAKDFIYGDMYGKADPIVFFSYPEYYGLLYVRLNPKVKPELALSKVETVMKKYNPAFPFEYKFVDDNFNAAFKSEMLIGKLSRVFAVLAILISCLGLFGLAAYTAERRTKEIGIRKVLGASITGITGLISKDFLRLVIIASVIAFPLSWWAMHSWLQNYSYRIDISWWVFVVAGILAVLIALVTVSFQAIKAALSNPVKSLRTE
ncbi:MAG: acetylornithine deacetylase [Bacteroidetes bacterium]|nr:MAG: acetylornithine deacetylase [Bacteroidota bacterium]